MCRGHYYYYYYITVAAGISTLLHPLTPPPDDDRPEEGPSDKNRARDAPHAAANKGWNEGDGKNVFRPTRRSRRRPLCVRAKKGDAKRAASDSIDCAIAGRDDIGGGSGVGVGLRRAGSPLRRGAPARTIPLTLSLTALPVGESSAPRAERATQRRARVDKRSLSPPLSCSIHSTLLQPLPPTHNDRLFIYYIRHPHAVAQHIYTPMTKLPCFVISLNVTNPSWFIIAEAVPRRPRDLSNHHPPHQSYVGFSYHRRRRKNYPLREKTFPSAAASQLSQTLQFKNHYFSSDHLIPHDFFPLTPLYGRL